MAKGAEFIQLQRIWYQKLRESGFEDIEDTERERCPLFTYHRAKFSIPDAMIRLSQVESYYALALDFYHEHIFENDLDQRIWQLHSEGSSVREIAKYLHLTCYKVHKILFNLKRIMLGKNGNPR